MVTSRPTLFGVSVTKSKFFLDKSVEPVFPPIILSGSPWQESFSLASERNLSVLTAVWLKPPEAVLMSYCGREVISKFPDNYLLFLGLKQAIPWRWNNL